MKQKSLEQLPGLKEKITRPPYEVKHAIVCNRNGIKIYYEAINNYQGKIVIDDNGKIRRGNATYKNQGQKFTKSDKLWWKVVEQLYTQEYLKLPEVLQEYKKAEVQLEVYLTIKKDFYEKQARQ